MSPISCPAALAWVGLVVMSGPLSAAPAAPAPPAAAASRPAAPDPTGVKVTVIEDQGARIEETRLRGAARRITVQSKLPGAPAYEIQVAPAGRDPSQEQGSTGRRTWSLLSF